ncbi:MAG TPA: NfeD family protein [Alphaproteobacteria bacterium]|nr:hypothetical protein [Rhodospirillaceae bacterium]HRJ12792.1 NfeD family protein [Alphaproteobacteria bacterium]
MLPELVSSILSGGAYAWWAIALLLLLVEMMIPSNWLLWPGLAAFATGGMLMLFPAMEWPTAILFFVAVSLLLLLIGRRYVRLSDGNTDAPNLNNRAGRMVGRRGAALMDGADGMSRIQIDGIEWPVRREGGGGILAGQVLEVTAFDGTTLVAKVIQV